ncbi:MAG: HEAT repeat domain-containing protein [Bacteroidetes bacterium]|nr:HEAT repeat domain-containing protein [Bacteroidota bacterium]
MIHDDIKQRLISLLSDPDADERRRSADALSQSHSAIVSSVLVLALQDNDKGVRDSAARSLLDMKSKSAAFAVAEYLVDSSFITRNLASNLLLQFGELSVEPLMHYAVHENQDVRKLAIDTLGLIGDPRALPVLCSLVNDPDDNVVLAVVEAFGNIKDPSVIPHLAMIFSTYAYSRVVVVEAMGKIGDAAAGHFLVSQLNGMAAPEGDDLLVNFAIVEALATTGSPAILDTVIRLCGNSSGKMRNIYLYALVCIAERYEMMLMEFDHLRGPFIDALQDDDIRIVTAATKALLSMMTPETEAAVLHLLGRNESLDQLILNNLQGGGRSFVALVKKYPSFQRGQKRTALEFILPMLNDLSQSDDEEIRSARADLFALLVGEWIDAEEEQRTTIMDAMFYLEEERSVAYFTDLINDTYSWLRMRVLELLAQISHYRSSEVLLQFVNEPDEKVRSFVTSVLISRGILSDETVEQG